MRVAASGRVRQLGDIFLHRCSDRSPSRVRVEATCQGESNLSMSTPLNSEWSCFETSDSLTKLRVLFLAQGLWIGLICGLSSQAATLLVITLRTKWTRLDLSVDMDKEDPRIT